MEGARIKLIRGFFFNLRFYLFIHDRRRERERQGHRRREKQAPCGEPDAGLDPGTPGSYPRLEAALNRRATGAAPGIDIFESWLLEPSSCTHTGEECGWDARFSGSADPGPARRAPLGAAGACSLRGPGLLRGQAQGPRCPVAQALLGWSSVNSYKQTKLLILS